MAACNFLGSGVSTRPYHTVCPTPIPVVCLSLVIRAAHTDLVRPLSFRSATLLASYFAFQVIRRPAAPIEFCRPHAPTGLELDPIHNLEVISCTAQFAFRLTGDPEHATTLSCLQRLVVVACLLTLAAGAGVGGWAPKIFHQIFHQAFLRCTVLKPRALSGACGARSYGLGRGCCRTSPG